MVRLRLAAVLLLAASSTGCSLLFNTDELPDIVVDAPTDAMVPIDAVDAPPPPVDAVDADVAALTLDSVAPMMLDEGTGTAGGRPAVVQIDASNLVADATVRTLIAGAEVPSGVVQTEIDDVHGIITVAIVAPVITTLGEGAVGMLTIEVSQGMPKPTVATIDVMIIGHEELDLDGTPATIDTSDALFTHTYSSITVSGPTLVTGDNPARLISHGGATINAALTVTAASCGGGGRSTAGACGTSGGRGGGGALGGDGGGGGFGTAGSPGTSATIGAGGAAVGVPQLVPLIAIGGGPTVHRAGGGGGGGPLLAAGLGGAPGGAGGGVIDLTARGRITVGASGRVIVAGGPATDGGLAGSGGGGAGGAILIRTGLPLTQAAPWLDARGGGSVGGGGAGGLGRIRIDVAGGDLADTSLAGSPAPVLGPSWDVGAPLIVRAPSVTLKARIAGTGGCYLLRPALQFVPDAEDPCAPMARSVSATGADVEFNLVAGSNRLCLAWTGVANELSGTLALPEALSCVDVFYFPPTPR